MSGDAERVGMKPPHPGVFIREEILEPFMRARTDQIPVQRFSPQT